MKVERLLGDARVRISILGDGQLADETLPFAPVKFSRGQSAGGDARMSRRLPWRSGAVGFFAFALTLERVETTIRASAEGVVALTGGSDRVLEAAELLARGQARRMLITGVNQATAGDDLKRILPVSRELFECCVDLGYRALDTAGNARETRAWLVAHDMKGPLIVVTSNYHMPRALAELSAAMPDVVLYPYPVVSEHVDVADLSDARGVLRLLTREYLKYLRALARTRWEGFCALFNRGAITENPSDSVKTTSQSGVATCSAPNSARPEISFWAKRATSSSTPCAVSVRRTRPFAPTI